MSNQIVEIYTFLIFFLKINQITKTFFTFIHLFINSLIFLSLSLKLTNLCLQG